MTSWHLDELDLILQQSGDASPSFQMCPPLLLSELIRINHFRMLAASPKPTNSTKEDLRLEAYRVLDRIHDFSPEQWADSKRFSKEDWMLLGNIYQAAVSVYCISSLQSLAVLPLTSSALRAHRTSHTQVLQLLLRRALLSPRVKRFMLWPLVVLGVEAAVLGGVAMRDFVKEQLGRMSRHAGTYVPLTAKGVLERFWVSGKTSWDSCFDKPYAFTTQIAVDMSPILLA